MKCDAKCAAIVNLSFKAHMKVYDPIPLTALKSQCRILLRPVYVMCQVSSIFCQSSAIERALFLSIKLSTSLILIILIRERDKKKKHSHKHVRAIYCNISRL